MPIIHEKFGIKEFKNYNYNNKLKHISKQILNIIKKIVNSQSYNYNSTLINNEQEIYVDKLSVSMESYIDWLDGLDVYIGIGLYSEKDHLYRFEESQYCIISDTAIYRWKNRGITKLNINYDIIFENEKGKTHIIPFLLQNNKVKRCSILISILPNDISIMTPDYLVTIIKHELGYIFDMFIQNKNQE